MSIIEFLFDVIGAPDSADISIIYYVIAGIILLIMLDGIISFLLSGISSLTMRGKK